MIRGDLVTVADRAGDYTGKPRPAVIVQSDRFPSTDSVTICPLSSVATEAPLLRLRLEPSESLALKTVSYVMVDKIAAVRRDRVGRVFGRLGREDLLRLDRSLVVFLGIG